MKIDGLPRELLVGMYRTMRTIRRFEERIKELFFMGEIPGFVHASIGEEAVPTGVCSALDPSDRITSNHRGHGHLIAKGGKLRPMMAELFGRRTGYCKGKGGSMHVVDLSIGILGANGIVGAGIPIATGSALASQLTGKNEVSVAFFGDGAANEGTFHESANLAAVWKLPVIFVCENNAYAEWTPISEASAVSDIAIRGQAYGMPGIAVDGNDVCAVYRAAREAAARARAGLGPTLLECKTYRWEGHVVGEEAMLAGKEYRSAEDLAQWKLKCPIERLATALKEAGAATAQELAEIDSRVEGELEDAVTYARQSEQADPTEAFTDLFA